MAKGPYLPNLEPFIAAGIDPKNNLPVKMTGSDPCMLKDNIKRILRINDEQLALNRFKWYNLPDGLDGQLIERILYYKGQAAFFYMESLDKFYFLPYTLEGSIDEYGRYTGITPIKFNGSSGTTEKEQKPWIKGMVKKPVYDIRMKDMKWSDYTDSCVLLSDYSKQLSQTILPRQTLNEALIDVESDCLPFLRTALQNGTGIEGMRVNSQDEYASVEMASRLVNHAALTGSKFVPTIGQIDFQELTNGQIAKSEEFLMSMQAIDNFRLGTFGLENGGLFQKKAHELQAESQMNSGAVGPVMQDGLSNRQTFCDIVNSLYGLGVWCDVAESNGIDRNGDGQLIDEQDQSGMAEGEQPQEVM